MKKQMFILAAVSLVLAGCQSGWQAPSFGSVFEQKPADTPLSATRVWPGEVQIRAVLSAQKTAWNKGDIETFMDGYWKSEDLRFASGDTVYTGWQATLDRYYETYPDRAAMGQLDFSDIDVELTSATTATVHGKWALARASDRPNGLFTLGFRKFGDDWLIVSDTTTSAG